MTKAHINLIIDGELSERMNKVMKRERITNKTAFISEAIRAFLDGKDENGAINDLHQMMAASIVKAEKEREVAAQQRAEILAYLDVMAQDSCGTKEHFEKFLARVDVAKTELMEVD